jgi:hypothetical protein
LIGIVELEYLDEDEVMGLKELVDRRVDLGKVVKPKRVVGIAEVGLSVVLVSLGLVSLGLLLLGLTLVGVVVLVGLLGVLPELFFGDLSSARLALLQDPLAFMVSLFALP